MPKKANTQEDTNTPLKFKTWTKAIKETKAKRPQAKLDLLVNRYVTDAKLSEALHLERKRGFVEVVASTDEVGRHFLPPSIETVRLRPKKNEKAELNPDLLTGHRPEHLGLRAQPEKLSRELQVAPQWRREAKRKDDLGEPGTIFAPDTRFVFSDTSFPWCTCGRVQTASGSGSGVMIGPRHMMTASHVINWGPNNTAGWVKFTPLQFDTSEPFGIAWATRI